LVEQKMAGGKGAKGGNRLQQSARWIHQRYQAPPCAIAAYFRRFGERRLGGNRRKLPEETLPWEIMRISPSHPRGALQTLDTDAFGAGGMGVAAMQYE
jgi:hypothetical protein